MQVPLIEGLSNADDLPYTISFAISYRLRIDSFNELPKEKRPPRNLWDKPYQLTEFLDHVWDSDKHLEKGKQFIDLDLEEVE